MHTSNPAIFHDCTHYCFSPLLFQPLWHQIAALTEAMGSGQASAK
jgi:hypothetical protein